MRATVTVNTPSYVNPFLDRPTQRYFRDVLRKFKTIIGAVTDGGVARRLISSGARQTTSVEYGTEPATMGVTVAAPADAATITLNGSALTGHQHRASCTVTFASVNSNDTLTVNGTVFTAKSSSPSGNYQFLSGVSDTADAAAFLVKLNAATLNSADAANGVGVYGLIEGKASAGVVTLYAIAEGTAGNSLTIVTSNGTRLAITNDSSGSFANGTAATNNEFDRIGNDARTARSVCTNLGLSSTAILNQHITAACRKGVVTCATVLSGSTVTLDRVALRSIKDLTDSGGARITTFPDDVFSIGTTDTTCAVALVNCINNHPRLRERFKATNSSGVVTIHERPPESTNPPPLTTSDGTTLAVTATTNGCLADSALLLFQAIRPGPAGNAITIASSSGATLGIDGSASRLASGASTTVTF